MSYGVSATDRPATCGIVGPKGRHVRPFTPHHRYDAPDNAMKALRAILAAFGVPQVSMQEVGTEAFFLGNRHRGEIREGALKELRAVGLDPGRAALLRAVLRTPPVPLPKKCSHDPR